MVNISTHPTNTPQLTPDPITIPSSPIARRRKIVQLGGYVHFVLYSSSRNPAESVQPYSRSFSKGKAHFPISFHLARHYQRLKRCYCRCRKPPLHVHSPVFRVIYSKNKILTVLDRLRAAVLGSVVRSASTKTMDEFVQTIFAFMCQTQETKLKQLAREFLKTAPDLSESLLNFIKSD